MSCIDLIFCTNQNVISNYGLDVSMFKKCHHDIIHGKIDICDLYMSVKSGITIRKILQYLIYNGTGPLKICL